MEDDKPVQGIYSSLACPKTPDSRVICTNDVQLPTVAEVNKKYPNSGFLFFSRRFQMIQENRTEDILRKQNVEVALIAVSKQEKETSFAGFSTEFMGHLLLTAMSIVSKSNAYNTNSGAFISGATGAQRYTDNREDAMKTTTTVVQKPGYMVQTLRFDRIKNHPVYEDILCPKEVEQDQWACLTVVATALEAAIAKN
jgi:hypothetical protein